MLSRQAQNEQKTAPRLKSRLLCVVTSENVSLCQASGLLPASFTPTAGPAALEAPPRFLPKSMVNDACSPGQRPEQQGRAQARQSKQAGPAAAGNAFPAALATPTMKQTTHPPPRACTEALELPSHREPTCTKGTWLQRAITEAPLAAGGGRQRGLHPARRGLRGS